MSGIPGLVWLVLSPPLLLLCALLGKKFCSCVLEAATVCIEDPFVARSSFFLARNSFRSCMSDILLFNLGLAACFFFRSFIAGFGCLFLSKSGVFSLVVVCCSCSFVVFALFFCFFFLKSFSVLKGGGGSKGLVQSSFFGGSLKSFSVLKIWKLYMCFKSVSKEFKRCPKVVTRLLQGCFRSCFKVFVGSRCKNVSNEFS